MSKRAIVVVDLQNEYLPSGKLPLEGIDRAVVNARRVVDAGRDAGVPIVHVRHEAPGNDAPFFVAGSQGVEIINAVRPAGADTVVVKHYPNSFRETDLKAVLDDESIDTVTLVGAMSHMCIAATARAAADLGYLVEVVHDACATLALQFDGIEVPAAQVHAANMAALEFGYAELFSSEAWVTRLG